jgi:kynureninase
MEATRAFARRCDNADPLAPVRKEFTLLDGVRYLDGNSLGALPSAVPGRLSRLPGRSPGSPAVTRRCMARR